jgi:Tfp pilus assembly protein PilF
MARWLLLMILTPVPALADLRMESILQQGLSAYESEQYDAAMAHFSAALTHSLTHQQSQMYPASYLCAMWYFGRGVARDPQRALTACQLAQGSLSRFQLTLFQQALESNSQSEVFPLRRAMEDAAQALDWYLRSTAP